MMEWQTWRTQNPLVAIPCGFKSHFRHQERGVFAREHRVFISRKKVAFSYLSFHFFHYRKFLFCNLILPPAATHFCQYSHNDVVVDLKATKILKEVCFMNGFDGYGMGGGKCGGFGGFGDFCNCGCLFWLILILCCCGNGCGNCICEILPLLLILCCCCNNKPIDRHCW